MTSTYKFFSFTYKIGVRIINNEKSLSIVFFYDSVDSISPKYAVFSSAASGVYAPMKISSGDEPKKSTVHICNKYFEEKKITDGQREVSGLESCLCYNNIAFVATLPFRMSALGATFIYFSVSLQLLGR